MSVTLLPMSVPKLLMILVLLVMMPMPMLPMPLLLMMLPLMKLKLVLLVMMLLLMMMLVLSAVTEYANEVDDMIAVYAWLTQAATVLSPWAKVALVG